jgi:enoyl-CoA hydratase
MSDGDLVVVEQRAVAALVTLNRPTKRNALSVALRDALADELERLAEQDQIRAIGIAGAGPAFCAGMDTTEFGGDAEHRRRLVDSSVRMFSALAQCPQPTVALVNGPALGGGFALALLCDVRCAGSSARFGFPEVARGIPPSYAAAASALGPALASDLCLSGRVLNAEQALAAGVASRARADIGVLAEYAEAPAEVGREIKRRIVAHRDGCSIAGLLADEARVMRAAITGRAT